MQTVTVVLLQQIQLLCPRVDTSLPACAAPEDTSIAALTKLSAWLRVQNML